MSTFGTLFRVTTYGESHCKSVGCIVDGCPPGLSLSASDIQAQLTRRRPGQSDLTTPRNEADLVELQSGTENDVTLGTPIGLLDYTETDEFPRPSHADFTYMQKYGLKSKSGGGRSSARETIGRVAAGAIAEKYLKDAYGIEIVAFVSSVGKVKIPMFSHYPSSSSAANGTEGIDVDLESDEDLSPEFLHLLSTVTRPQVDSTEVRCPHPATADQVRKVILHHKSLSDSIGGSVMCVIRNMPTGLGEPCFDKLEAKLAHAMLSIPATKGFEIGSGFRGTEMRGSRHNDLFIQKEGRLGTESNRSGGVQGGISNGEDIYFRVGFKPPATISQSQSTASYDGTPGVLTARGRHDPCVVPRAVPIVEAMAALVIMDAVLQQNARRSAVQLIKPLAFSSKQSARKISEEVVDAEDERV
ncbi:chorismate synthase [Atractiella rhizophila]|nr:chorismate synthase [Atractiella rhizophila]